MESDRKEEIAAHQAVCSCHPVSDGCEIDNVLDARREMKLAADSGGQEWHIDPLCKVRPGRMMEET